MNETNRQRITNILAALRIGLGFALSIGLGNSTDLQAQSSQTERLRGIVVNEDDKPISATVVEYHTTAMDRSPLVVRNDNQGHFLMSKESFAVSDSVEPLHVAIFSPGHKVVGVRPADVGDRPIKIRLQKDEPISVRVINQQNLPVSGARIVTGAGLSFFRDLEKLANCLAENKLESFISTSDSDGNSVVRGSSPGEMKSIAVCSPTGTWALFMLPKKWDVDHPIELKMPRSDRDLTVCVKDSEGHPVPDAKVWLRTPSDTINDNVITNPVSMDFRSGTSDKNGLITFANIAIPEVEVWVFFWHEDGRNVIRRGIVVKASEENRLELNLPPYEEISFSVIDIGGEMPVPGVEFLFQVGSINLGVKSNEDGIVTARLPPGNWSCSVKTYGGIPDGYCAESPEEFSVDVQKGKRSKILPFAFRPGQVMEAEVRNADLRDTSFSWVRMNIKNVEKAIEKEIVGKIISDNKIRFTIPKGLTASDLADIYTSDGMKLEVVSTAPLVMEPVADSSAR